MTSPSLDQLPPPPPGRTGWPWTVGTVIPQHSSALPRISIVTPSYNQAPFLEETLRSILLQGYPNLEFHVLDGGSQDGSVAILEKYAPFLTSWSSARDGGQADAVRRGFDLCHGDILNWVNSDDVLFPGALFKVAAHVQGRQHSKLVVYGSRYRFDVVGNITQWEEPPAHLTRLHLRMGTWIPQETVFFTRTAYNAAGGMQPGFRSSLDYDLWARLLTSGARFERVDGVLGGIRLHQDTKSVNISHVGWEEFLRSRVEHLGGRRRDRLANAWVDGMGRQLFFRLQDWKCRLLKGSHHPSNVRDVRA